MTKNELEKILYNHKLWLIDKSGKQADLYGANLERANLKGVNLEKANLEGVNLEKANLERANLRGANLYGANLYKADVYGADLREANLYGANLYGAYLYGADLYEVDGIYTFIAYDTSRRIVYCVKHKNTWMIKAGCFWGTLEELEAKVKATHNSKVYLANIELLKELQ